MVRLQGLWVLGGHGSKGEGYGVVEVEWDGLLMAEMNLDKG